MIRARLTAAAVATVAAGAVLVPPAPPQLAAARFELATVQLQAAVSTEAGALLDTVGDLVPTEVPAAQAVSTLQDGLGSLALGVGALALAPLWYAAFPVTLPLSVVGGMLMMSIANLMPINFGAGGQLDSWEIIGTGGLIGLGAFLAGPIGVGISALSSLFSPSVAYSAAAATSAVAAASATSVTDTLAGIVTGIVDGLKRVASVLLAPILIPAWTLTFLQTFRIVPTFLPGAPLATVVNAITSFLKPSEPAPTPAAAVPAAPASSATPVTEATPAIEAQEATEATQATEAEPQSVSHPRRTGSVRGTATARAAAAERAATEAAQEATEDSAPTPDTPAASPDRAADRADSAAPSRADAGRAGAGRHDRAGRT